MTPAKRKPILIGRDPAELKPVIVGSEYQAGVCNIGPAEIARRRRFGHVAVLAALVLLAVLIALHVSPLWRMLIALPAAGAASGYIQARMHFCANFGSRGVYNLGEVGTVTSVADAAARARDRARAMQITLASVLIGLVAGVVAVLLPV
jgi:hypothetical protein